MKKKASDYKITVTFDEDQEECERRFQKVVELILSMNEEEPASSKNSPKY